MNFKAEQIRKHYLYRQLVLSGDAMIKRETAKKMVGPDCAYQLYRKVQSPSPFAEASEDRESRVQRKATKREQ